MELCVQDIDAVRQDLGVDKVTLLGHSFGGGIAMQYVIAYPDHVRGMILMSSVGVDSGWLTYFNDNIFDRLSKSDLASYQYWTEKQHYLNDPDKAVTQAFLATAPAYFYDPKNFAAFVDSLPPNWFNVNVYTALKTERGNNYDLSAALRKYDGPVLIIQGRQDVIGESTAYKSHAILRNSEIVFIEQCGHFPWFEQPDVLHRKLADFITDKISRLSAKL